MQSLPSKWEKDTVQDQGRVKPKVGVLELRVASKKGYFKGKWESGNTAMGLLV